ncbi:MAG: HAD family hydrolase, partial [Nocardioides sp.]
RALLLWDIDHTLIENGGVSKQNYQLAFRLLTGRDPVVRAQTDGRTDVGIMEALLAANDVPLDRYTNDEQVAALEQAGSENAGLLAARGRALPGALEALRLLGRHRALIQSVLTGNIEANARAKLGAFGLDSWVDFTVGGYGETHSQRGMLIAVAQGRAAQRYGFDPATNVTVVLGDTVRDVEAGLFGGAKVIGIANGAQSTSELLQAGAHEALPGLADLTALTSVISRVSGIRVPVPSAHLLRS